MSLLTTVDDHGIVEYRNSFLVALIAISLVCTVSGFGYLMYLAENATGNVSSWSEGNWVISMTITTIGYGDFYPVTHYGRIISWSAFVMGAIEVGLLIGVLNSAMGTDRSIQNRELRTMLCEVMRKLEHLESHLDMSTAVTTNSHHLDVVFEQYEYSSDTLRDGYLTCGKDSSGMYMMSVNAYDRGTNQEIHRWIPESSKEGLLAMAQRYLNNDKEL